MADHAIIICPIDSVVRSHFPADHAVHQPRNGRSRGERMTGIVVWRFFTKLTYFEDATALLSPCRS